MVAARHLEAAAGVGIDALLDCLDPGTTYPEWYFVLALARGRTRMATNARSIVYDKSVVHER